MAVTTRSTIPESAGRHPRRASRGFSLLEVVVVLTIAALLAALVPPLFSGTIARAELRGTAASLAATLRLARSRAITEAREVALTLHLGQRWYRLGNDTRKRPLPVGIATELETAQRQIRDQHQGDIRFFPDGSSSGGRIRLSAGDTQLVVDVDWFSGGIRVVE